MCFIVTLVTSLSIWFRWFGSHLGLNNDLSRQAWIDDHYRWINSLYHEYYTRQGWIDADGNYINVGLNEDENIRNQWEAEGKPHLIRRHNCRVN